MLQRLNQSRWKIEKGEVGVKIVRAFQNRVRLGGANSKRKIFQDIFLNVSS